MYELLGWIEAHQGLAGWAQAAAAAIGLGLAVWVPWKMRLDERREAKSERRLRARAVAVAIYPEVLEMRLGLNRLESTLRGMAPPGEDIKVEGEELWGLVMKKMPALDRNYDSLYLLGSELGADLLQLISIFDQINRVIVETANWTHFSPTPLAETHVAMAKKLIDQIVSGILPIHDGAAARG